MIRGFTVVELLVVVSTVSIMGVVGVISYDGYVGNARSVEAKVKLSNAKTSLEVFGAEKGSYTSCLKEIGAAPKVREGYFGIGAASVPGANICGPQKSATCYATEWDSQTGDVIIPCNHSSGYTVAAKTADGTYDGGFHYLNIAGVAHVFGGVAGYGRVSQEEFEVSSLGRPSRYGGTYRFRVTHESGVELMPEQFYTVDGFIDHKPLWW